MEKTINSEKVLLFFAGLPNPNEKEALAYYGQESRSLFIKKGVKPIGNFGIGEQMVGEYQMAFINYAEFPNEQAARDLFASEEYKALIPHRNKAFLSLNIYLVDPKDNSIQIDSDKSLLLTLVSPNPAEMDAMQSYAKGSGALAQQMGAHTLSKFGVKEQLLGDCPAAIIGFAEMDKAENWQAFFQSESYATLIPERKKGFQAVNAYLLAA